MNRMTRLAFVVVFAVAGFSASLARADGPTSLVVDQTKSSVAYTIIHKFHTVVGTSKKPEGVVRILPDGIVQVMVRAPIASFDSENTGRDEHMQETMEVTKFPNVGFKGASKIAIPTTFPTTVKVDMKGELDFHGQKQLESIPVEVTFTSATEAKVTSKFEVSLDKYKVDRPSLMLIKINDPCQIALDLVLKRQ